MDDATSATTATKAKFPRAFWLANGIELLERGAYYSFNAALTVFMLFAFQRAGMDLVAAASLAGTLSAVLFFLLYVIPVIAAPLSEKFGYKASLAVVFAFLIAGYAVTFVATGVTMIVLAVVLIGVGAGIFKPIPAAIVSQTSHEKHRNLAFSIYYACINIGAFVFPVGLGLVGAALGYTSTDVALARIVFATSAVLVAINLLLSLFVFQNLREPRRDVSVLGSLRMLREIGKHPSFLVLMVIYTGFWVMYVLSLTFLNAYMVQFQRMPPWFNTLLLQSINPLVIIVLAPFTGIVSKRIDALPLMVGGIILYALGLVTLGFTTTSFFFVAGVVLFSVGELLTHPSYLSYVSKIAPPDKVSVFLGFGFIPIGVGQFLGAKIGGDLYGRIALAGGAPKLFWAIMAAVGLATAAALAIYNLALARRTAPKAIAPGPVRGPERRPFPVGVAMAAIAILLVPAVLAAATLAPASGGITPAATGSGLDASSLADVKLADNMQTIACAQEYTTKVALPANATGTATFALTWKAPTPSSPAMQTTPDRYVLHVTPPGGAMVMTQPATNGSLELRVPAKGGDYAVTVKLEACGGESPATPVPIPGGLGATQRTSGAFTLGGSYQTPK